MQTEIRIGNRTIGKGYAPFIIAEAGINHNGDIKLAKKMIHVAKEAGADAVKFQTFHAEEFIQDKTAAYTYHSQGKEVTESMFDMFKRNEFTKNEWSEIVEFCKETDIHFLSTPQNVSDLELLIKLGIDAIKVGSDDFINIPLIQRYAQEKLPLLLSCGMADEEEIESTLTAAGAFYGKPIVLLLCTSEYPTPPKDVNISKLKTLSNKYPQIILGLSDHTQSNEAAVMALTLDAVVFEKHFTIDHDLPGPDHWFSNDPQELKSWVKSIRISHEMMGSDLLKPTEAEQEMRKLAHRSITASKDIHMGDILSEQNLTMRRPGKGIPAKEWNGIIGRKALTDIPCGKLLKWEEIGE